MVPSFTCTSNEEACLYRSVLFGDGPGTMIVKRCFDRVSMQRLTALLQDKASGQPQYVNAKHPLQNGKRIGLEYMSEVDPTLALTILSNSKLNKVLDAVLGHAYIASLTGHTLFPGARQQRLPSHIYSGKIWGNGREKFKNQSISPHSAIQALIAPVKIGHSNGGTLLVQASHRVPDIDLVVHEPGFQRVTKEGECNMLVCPDLEPGDVLLFNREIAHCGGANTTAETRPVLIGQWSPFHITPQHVFNTEAILHNVQPCQKHDVSLSDFVSRVLRPFCRR